MIDAEGDKITVVLSLTRDEWDRLAVIGKADGLPLDKRIPLWLENTVFQSRYESEADQPLTEDGTVF